MATVVYAPRNDEEILDLDPATGEPFLTPRPMDTDNTMLILVMVGSVVLAAVVILIVGLGFVDLIGW
jgi:hypothetical protein